jgi:hypothetical protein
VEAELAPAAGCGNWPAAFTASATISVASGSAAYQGTYSCESRGNQTAGVPASTHFVFFCTIGQRTGPPSGSSFVSINVSALGPDGAVLGTFNQSYPGPATP